MSGWRVWFAFEVRPGISRYSTIDLRDHFRGLAKTCRKSDGKIDTDEFEHWLDILVEHSHLLGNA